MRNTSRILPHIFKGIFKGLLAVLALLLALPLTHQSALAAGNILAPLPDLKGREVIVVTAQDYLPFTFVDSASNKGVGYEYELWNELCLRLNCKVTFKVAAWDGMIVAVQNKQYDVGMDGISITPERQKQVDFSAPYITVEQKMLIRADETRFTDSKSFVANTALKFGAQSGTTGFDVITGLVGKDNIANRATLFDDFGLSVQSLLAGKVDAVITDAVSGRGYIGANAGKLKMLDETLNSDPLGFMFPQGSDLVTPVNAGIAAMKTDGYLTYLENKWFVLYDPNAK